jgi:hypothetical protein
LVLRLSVISCSKCEANLKIRQAISTLSFMQGEAHQQAIQALREKRSLPRALRRIHCWVAYVPGGGAPVQTC